MVSKISSYIYILSVIFALFGFMVSPVWENTLSVGAELAGTHRTRSSNSVVTAYWSLAYPVYSLKCGVNSVSNMFQVLRQCARCRLPGLSK